MRFILLSVVLTAMSKAGLERMVQALALEWGPHGVRVNGIAPGFILTDLTEKLWSDPNMQSWGRTNTPQGRLGRPRTWSAPRFSSQSGLGLHDRAVGRRRRRLYGEDLWSWPIPPG
ncbi:MAG: SDR family oxidoreductase [Pirellulaceae bacterium]